MKPEIKIKGLERSFLSTWRKVESKRAGLAHGVKAGHARRLRRISKARLRDMQVLAGEN